jgi:hypothetical protein
MPSQNQYEETPVALLPGLESITPETKRGLRGVLLGAETMAMVFKKVLIP